MTCPFCKADMQDGAIQCKHCRVILNSHKHETVQAHHHQVMPPPYEPQGLSFTHLFISHNGRTNRAKYWLGNLLLWVMCTIALGIFESIHAGLGLLPVLIMIYPSVMLFVKRAHDLDRSGHFCWLLLIPLVSIVPTIMLSFFKGTTGPNRFGPDPRSPSPVTSPKVPFSQAV
jgi:uncharacterized membrane protein YhaH (DUF805 family)